LQPTCYPRFIEVVLPAKLSYDVMCLAGPAAGKLKRWVALATDPSLPTATIKEEQVIASTRFPSNVKNITPELLTSVLAERRPQVVVENLRVIERARCGDGIASTADRVVLGLDYAPGCDAGLPSRVVLKTLLLHRYLRPGLPSLQRLSRTLNRTDSIPVLGKQIRPRAFSLITFYQKFFPQAPEAMYLTEVRFYHDIRHELDIETPQAFASVFDEKTGQFGVVMEDLSLRSARFPNATTPVTLEEITSIVTLLAKLHAHLWASPRLEQDLSWVPTTSSGGMYPVFDAIGLDLIRDQVKKNKFKQELIAPLKRSLDQMWKDLWKVQEIFNAGPITLLHGDPHIGNTYLLPDGQGGLIDWQLMVKGCWANDLTYLLVTGLEPEVRRKHERDLITLYLEELRRRGVEQAPSENEAWKCYRQGVVWGLVIGWLITPPQNYGQAITEANISRIVTAAQDLETFQAL